MLVEQKIPPVNEQTVLPAAVDYFDLIKKVSDYIKKYMKEHMQSGLYYHNLTHTENVVAAATQIAHHYGLRNREFFIVVAASWFHDLGYFENILNHELASAAMTEAFLKSNEVDDETIDDIKGCILATKVPQTPATLLEQIVCDADLYHLGTEGFTKFNKLLRKEVETLHHIRISKSEWRNRTIYLLENHHFQTEYCKDLLKKKKNQNLEQLKKKDWARELTKNPMDELLREHLDSKPDEEEFDKSYLLERPDRGVDSLFRIASGVSQRLNEQADTKAHILISVNSIIISVFLTLVVRRLDDYPYLVMPVTMLLIVNLTTIIFSILATRPNSASGTFFPADIDEKKVNLLFFGNFYRMGFDDYAKGMFQVIGDKHFLYLSLIRNLYDQGIILGRKYRMLQVAYNVFMFGLIISVVTFVISSRYFSK